jgi:HSP20 family protein
VIRYRLRLPRPEGATVTARRRRSGKIAQVFHLGNQLDAEKLSAEVLNGVLTVTIPVAESAKPRKVAVGVGAAPAIDASSTES